VSQQQLGEDAMAFLKELEKEPWKLNQMSLHEPTIPDLLQALQVMQEREREHLLNFENMKSSFIQQCVMSSGLIDTIHRLETELATLRAGR
jgi:hypothetical protein